MLNSLRKLSGLERYSIMLPNIGRLNIYIMCTVFNDELAKLVESIDSSETLIVLVPSFLAKKHSLLEMTAALLEAYTLVKHGFSKAKRKGLEALRILCGERNLGKVASICGAKRGETVVMLMATPYTVDELSKLEKKECSIKPRATRDDVTRVAVYPVEARLFKIHATGSS